MAVFSLCQYYQEQRTTLPPLEAPGDVHSKTFVVTGSNVGLGFEASVQLAEMAPKLLIPTSRDMAKCERTRQAILERADVDGVPSPSIAPWPLDLDSFDNVRSFADRFATGGEGALNALVANAGLFVPDYVQTQDGWETMLQVNYLSTALLSILFLPHLVNASTPESASRLTIVTSFGHYLAPVSLKHAETWTNVLETVNSRKFASSVTRYNITKLFQVMFVRELAARLPDPTPVVACTVNPGYCRSSLFRAMEYRWYVRWIFPAVQRALVVRPTEEGSKTLVHPVIASDVHARAMHGRYISSCEVVEESDFVFTPQGKAISAKLWNETITVLSRVDKRVPDIVAKYL